MRLSNHTFRQNVEGLTRYLQAEYDLSVVEDVFELVDGWKCGHVTLANKFVKIRLPAGSHRVEQSWPTRDAGPAQEARHLAA